MKLFMEVCHTTLEYDMARMFTDMGIEVYSDTWDLQNRENPQRPTLKGVTDTHIPFSPSTDVVVLFQTPDHPNKAFHYCLNYNIPVILIAFGQSWTKERVEFVCETARNFDKLTVVAYSITECDVYAKAGMPPEQLKLIRFPKYLEDYGPWTGGNKKVYISCNSIARDNPNFNRALACNYELVKTLYNKYGIPLVLSGNETEKITFGVGPISWNDMRKYFRESDCFFSNGTAPASLTLSLIEAMCSGTPVVAYDNGYGIKNEHLTGVIISRELSNLASYIKGFIDNPKLGKTYSNRVLETARQLFDVNQIKKQWIEILG